MDLAKPIMENFRVNSVRTWQKHFIEGAFAQHFIEAHLKFLLLRFGCIILEASQVNPSSDMLDLAWIVWKRRGQSFYNREFYFSPPIL